VTLKNGVLRCDCCAREIADADCITIVNPRGGYGLPEFAVCDWCLHLAPAECWIGEHRERLREMGCL
jgi:hypothetical protein